MTSEEIVITTNDRADTADDCEKLAEILAQAKATDTTNFTQASLERLNVPSRMQKRFRKMPARWR